MKYIGFLNALGLLMFCQSLWAGQVYYVGKACQAGETCATACTQAMNSATPLPIINAGIGCMSGGDTLIIGGGVYDEILVGGIIFLDPILLVQPNSHNIPNGLSQTNYTIIRSAPGETVTLRTATKYPGGGGVITVNLPARYITFDGINVDAGKVHTWGVKVSGTRIRYLNAEIKEAKSDGISNQDGDFVEWINLDVHHNGHFEGAKPVGHGLYVCGDNKLIEKNNVHDNVNFGIQVSCEGGGIQNAIVRYNIVSNNTTRGIQIQGHGNLVHSNLLVNNGIGIGIGGGSGARVYNNTIYGFSPLPDNYGIITQGSSAKIKNNLILKQKQTTSFNRYIFIQSGSVTIENNMCDFTGKCSIVETNINNIITDELNLDLRLKLGSRAIDAGVPLTEVPFDADGVSRPQGVGYDIGAFEFVQAVSSAPSAPEQLQFVPTP